MSVHKSSGVQAERKLAAPPLEVRDLRRSFGATTALDGATFAVRPGLVTAFLGPNGAGKTTAIRILLGLDHPDGGDALVHGRPFRQLEQPARTVGSLLDSAGFHPGRTGRQHLLVLASLADVSRDRVDAVLEEVGLTDAAGRKVAGYSLGMRRRLGLASALLADPEILVLDEPTNGLDPAGSRWLRGLLRRFADDGGTVLVSSHLLGEVAEVADDAVVIHRGRVVAQSPVDELTNGEVVAVRTRRAGQLAEALRRAGIRIERTRDDLLEVTGSTSEAVGLVAAAERIPLLELTSRHRSLEELFFSLTEDRS